MREVALSGPHDPFVLSLSKDRFFFGPLRSTHEEQLQCFDKLSTNGVGETKFL